MEEMKFKKPNEERGKGREGKKEGKGRERRD